MLIYLNRRCIIIIIWQNKLWLDTMFCILYWFTTKLFTLITGNIDLGFFHIKSIKTVEFTIFGESNICRKWLRNDMIILLLLNLFKVVIFLLSITILSHFHAKLSDYTEDIMYTSFIFTMKTLYIAKLSKFKCDLTKHHLLFTCFCIVTNYYASPKSARPIGTTSDTKTVSPLLDIWMIYWL